jgi:threonylcarbamoyladenosine tRNA methylthiotransferase MtaB
MRTKANEAVNIQQNVSLLKEAVFLPGNQSKKVCLINLGCKVNRYESDCMITQLEQAGYATTYHHEWADYYIVNTCAVTGEAEKKSRQTIAKINKLNENAKIVMCGCACVKNKEQFKDKKNVIAVIGNAGKENIVEILKGNILPSCNSTLDIAGLSNPHKSQTRSYIKIQDGCNKFCTYCIIPYVRGRSRSRALHEIVAESISLAQHSKEIVITGIDVSSFKVNEQQGFPLLLSELKTLPARIRLSSLEVGIITEELLQVLKSMPNFCEHFHLSLQSGSNTILKKMNRRYNAEVFLEKIALIRSYFPHANITSDIIVGFANESEEEFNETLAFAKAANFGEIHIFPYSPREGTVAYGFENLPKEKRKQRAATMQSLANELKLNYLKSRFNEKEQLLVEDEENGYTVGYTGTYMKCYIKNNQLKNGELVSIIVKEPFLDGCRCELADAKVTKKNEHSSFRN